MSSVYQTEPPTSGKVILKTSMGDIDIELWTLEAPKACRNFIQLCLEGYYDGTIFHRLISNFMIQGGDPTGTGKGGQSVYGEPFKDEFHQRLKFTHRGLVAMVNEDRPNSNGSQFFLTFGECQWIDKKNTIFGKVTGDSIYNLMQLKDIDTDSNQRPLVPPKVLKTSVVLNPFDDIVLRSDEAVKLAKVSQYTATKQSKIAEIPGMPSGIEEGDASSDEDDKKEELLFKQQNEKKKAELIKQKQRKAEEKVKKLKNKNLLSFMDEDEEDAAESEEEPEKPEEKKKSKVSEKKVMSIHDVATDDKQFSKQSAVDINELEQRKKKIEEEDSKKRKLQEKIRTADSSKQQFAAPIEPALAKKRQIENSDSALETRAELAEKNSELMKYSTRLNPTTGKMEIYWANSKKESSSGSSSSGSGSESSEDEMLTAEEKATRKKQKQEYENLKISYMSTKKNGLGTNSAEMRTFKAENTKLLSTVEKRKQMYLEKEKTKQHEGNYMERLESFKNRMKSGPSHSWVKHELHFQVTGDRAFQDFDARERVREYNINEDTQKKGFSNKAVDQVQREMRQKQEDTQARTSQKLTVEDLMELAED